MKPFKSIKALTLVEILIAAAIGLVVTTGTLRFLIQALKTYQYETGKLLVTRDIRKFTTQMVDDATYANYFMIFDQTSNLSRAGATTLTSGGDSSGDPTNANYRGYAAELATLTDPDDSGVTSPPTSLGKNYVQSGLTGDVVVFVYNKDGDNSVIYQLIIYYRPLATTSASNGTNSTSISARTSELKRIVVRIYSDGTTTKTNPTNPQFFSILRLLPDLANVPSTTMGTNNPYNQTIFPYVDGQANANGSPAWRTNKMFYNLNNTSVLVRGRIYENYTAQRLVKSTYNFTVTPRG